MARVNYGWDKRQKDLARQKKQEEKRQRRLQKGVEGETAEPGTEGVAEGETGEPASPDADAPKPDVP